MNFKLSEEQKALRQGVRSFLQKSLPLERLPKLAGGLDRALWRELADLGAFKLRLGEAEGGSGLGMTEAVLVYAELGRALFPGPVIWPNVAAGWIAGDLVVGGADLLHGTPEPLLVEFGGALDVLVALRPEGVYRFESSAVSWQSVPSPFDPLTAVARLGSLPKGERIAGPEASARAHLEAVALAAAQLLGISEATLELALAYAKTREQFGRPIGSFQAMKHMMADMFVRQEAARAAVYTAGVLLDEAAAPDAFRAVSSARLVAGDAAMKNARACIQIHGGMGYTWEIPAHYFLKRTWLLETAFGSAGEHARGIAQEL